MDQVSLARVSVVAAGLLAQDGCGGGGGGEPEHGAAVLDPRPGQGPHGGGLARAGGGDRELQPRPGGGHASYEGGLPGVEGDTVGGQLEQRQRDRLRGGPVPVGHPCGGDEAALGGEDLGAGEQGGAGDLVHAGAVGAAQLRRLVHAVAGRGQAHRRGGQGVVGDQVDDGLDVLGWQVRGADLAVRLGAHVPDLPRRAVGLHLVADPVRGVPDPRGVDGR